MGNIINEVASKYEMPKMSNIYLANNGDRICNTCNKEDVCMYKGELAYAVKEISKISERENVFIDTDIKCVKWSGRVNGTR